MYKIKETKSTYYNKIKTLAWESRDAKQYYYKADQPPPQPRSAQTLGRPRAFPQQVGPGKWGNCRSLLHVNHGRARRQKAFISDVPFGPALQPVKMEAHQISLGSAPLHRKPRSRVCRDIFLQLVTKFIDPLALPLYIIYNAVILTYEWQGYGSLKP